MVVATHEGWPVDRSGRCGRGRLPRAVALACAIALGCVAIGCRSDAVLAFRGARHYAIGSEALVRGETRRAVDELEQAARLVPHASEIQNHLGLAFEAEERPAAARRAFERAIELDCENEAAHANLARLMRASRESGAESETPDASPRGLRDVRSTGGGGDER